MTAWAVHFTTRILFTRIALKYKKEEILKYKVCNTKCHITVARYNCDKYPLLFCASRMNKMTALGNQSTTYHFNNSLSTSTPQKKYFDKVTS